MSINDIRDYASLQKLAQSLWGSSNDVHGAAIMVGAGFSRTAARCGDDGRAMPLWADLTSVLARELNLKPDKLSDPLRLAEQYVAFFGRRSLIELVRTELCDSAWSPGTLYKQLLKLPWKEILTTNWDTLLERSADSIFEPKYSVVNQQSDLAIARPPRITKLHGTIGVTQDLIFTQEDYRQYTHRHATFVNFARQVFIENELCLLGFSGDDPNFLQWAGWVRDRLDDHARRIFLVGNLSLSESYRKYLESINIAPIDLHELVCHIPDINTQFKSAIDLFLDQLLILKPKSPSDWTSSKLPSPAISSRSKHTESSSKNPSEGSALGTAEHILKLLKMDRESFPKWLLCPRRHSLQLSDQLASAVHTLRSIEGVGSPLESQLLFEIIWRIGATYQTISSDMADEVVSAFESTEIEVMSSRMRSEAFLITLRCLYPVYTERGKEAVERVTLALDPLCQLFPDVRDERHFLLAAVARDQLDFGEMTKHANAIRVSSPTAVQKKAALLVELGRISEAESLFAESYSRLAKDYSGDRASLPLQDRLAWARHLAKGISHWSSSRSVLDDINFSEDADCDPWQYFEFLRDRLQSESEIEAKQNRVEATFTPGSYKEGANRKFVSNEPDPVRILYGICNLGGIPLRWNNVSFLGDDAKKACTLKGIPWRERLALALRVADLHSSPVLDRTLSRVEIACLGDDDAQEVLRALERCVEFWKEKAIKRSGIERSYAFRRLGCMMEALGRLSVRAESHVADSLFKKALNIGSNPSFRSLELAVPLRTLIDNAWRSILPENRVSNLADILGFPLAAEVFDDSSANQEWPGVSFLLSGERPLDSNLDRRVSQLIDYVGKSKPYTSCSLVRLYPMARARMLRPNELQSLKRELFRRTKSGELPFTGIFPSALLSFFQDDSGELLDLVKSHLFTAPSTSKLTIEYLDGIRWACDDDLFRITPSEDEACQLFQLFCSWRPRDADRDVLGFRSQEDRQIARLLGGILSSAVIPQLPKKMLTVDNLSRVAEMSGHHKEIVATEGFAHFVAHDQSLGDTVKKLIVAELHDEEPRRAISAARAIVIWHKAEKSQITENLCSRLIHVAASSQTSALHGILESLAELYSDGCLTVQQKQSLVEILPIVFDSSDYKHRRFSRSGLDAASVSLTRRECVRIASAVLKDRNDADLERIIALGSEDPLPEVRFACILSRS